MQCSDVYVFICENLGNDLNSPECREIKEHLDGCPDCSVHLDSLKKVVALYKQTPAPEVSPSIHARILQLIDREWTPESPGR
jgi:Putative zinc-finger